MREQFIAAKKEIEEFNSRFGYAAGVGEIAAEIWHNHASVSQRVEIMKMVGMVQNGGVNNINAMYKAVEAIIS